MNNAHANTSGKQIKSNASGVSQKQTGYSAIAPFASDNPAKKEKSLLQEITGKQYDVNQRFAIPAGSGIVQHHSDLTAPENKPVLPMPVQRNNTGLPDNLKTGIEQLSGYSMNDVSVNYNSSAPAQMQAHAFASGTDIHIAPGQEKHLAHEAWHVVQQKQGRVRATTQLKNVAINDDAGLEKEADQMGQKSLGFKAESPPQLQARSVNNSFGPVQRKIGFEFEVGAVETFKNPTHENNDDAWAPHSKGEVLTNRNNYSITADINGNGSQLEFVTKPIDETKQADRDKLTQIAADIPVDLEHIAYYAGINNGDATLAQIPRFNGSQWQRFSTAQHNWRNMAGQLQMTGGVKINALPSVMSGEAMPDEAAHYAANYQGRIPGLGGLKQPVYHAALAESRRFRHLDGRPVADEAAEIIASILALMAQIPLNARGWLTMDGQGQFLARTDYAKILQLLCEHSEILLDPPSFTRCLVNVINRFAQDGGQVNGDDSVYPDDYVVAGQTFTNVSLQEWAEGVLPSLGYLWGYWQGKDLITKKNYPGTQDEKKELRPFGEFGSKTDPGNKIILEWRNLQGMYADQLQVAMDGLADYLRDLNNV